MLIPWSLVYNVQALLIEYCHEHGVVFLLVILNHDMTHSQMLGKVESGGGPIFKVVLEC